MTKESQVNKSENGHCNSPIVTWYGERGIVNAVVTKIKSNPVSNVRNLLEAVRWADSGCPNWISEVNSVHVCVEIGLAHFGDPDLILVCKTEQGVKCVFVEVKVIPYCFSMRSNDLGMEESGFNSSINGQLSLKYRFAKALESTAVPNNSECPDSIREPEDISKAYQKKLNDTKQRHLDKPGVIDMLDEWGLVGIPEKNCHYIAWTWDQAEKAFVNSSNKDKYELPLFVDENDNNLWDDMQDRIGWIGYKEVENAFNLVDNTEFQRAFKTMQEDLAPSAPDYETGNSLRLERLSDDIRKDIDEIAKRFSPKEVKKCRGSYSIMKSGQTVGKIIPCCGGENSGIFVGVRETGIPVQDNQRLLEKRVQSVLFKGFLIKDIQKEEGKINQVIGYINDI